MASGGPDWTEIVLAVVAVPSLLLNVVQFAISRRDRKPHILVELATVYVETTSTIPPEVRLEPAIPNKPLPDHLVLLAANKGLVTVTIGGYFLFLPDGQDVMPRSATRSFQTPCALSHGQSCSVWFPIRDFARSLAAQGSVGKVKLIGVYKDQIGRMYRSKPYEFDVDAWAAPV